MKELTKTFIIVFILFMVGRSVWAQKPDKFLPNKTYKITKSISDGYVKGEVGVYYKNSFTPNDSNRITRPFIMVEGFDAASSNNLNNKEGLYGTYGTMFENLRADGWDVA